MPAIPGGTPVDLREGNSMKGLTGRCAILAATAMGVVLATPSMAQDAADEAYEAEAIVVTARRT